MVSTPRPGGSLPDDARARARSVRRRAGVLWWRLRFAVAALCCGVAAATAVSALSPDPPPTVSVVVTAREVSAGAELAAADVRVVDVPADLAPEALRSPDDAVGRSASVRIAPGTALQESLVAAGDLVSAAPPGTVVAPVRLDPGISGLLAAGDRVDLLVASAATGLTGVAGEPAPADGASPYLARGAVVVPGRPGESASGGLLGSPTVTGEQVTLVAVLPEEAERLAAVAGWGQVTAVLVP
ncbi:SAF domain-containing protein [Cellulosimicrobium sp. Marseille-Q4280]|uniref:SAF domain-containing protein n=1 Tax=Cellulosimicrobium sp. Marseille-Q4280 TaxID=2937992 RepID=UPI00203F14B9|nr:SAF domain-containing protein [Cellulosimicrobium sp. Marseille-Q4280]